MLKYLVVAVVVFNTILCPSVNGHGMMMDPPNRASRWKAGFPGPKEYTDNQLSCGGRNVQWGKHRGKCGVCGDEYGIPNPKFHYPGDFAIDPPLVKTYDEGQIIEVAVKITANHKGYFTFRLAPLVNPPIKQHELDVNMLRVPNGNAEWKLPAGNDLFKIKLQLPKGLSCAHCVLQWWWTTGNNYINDKPETFVNCADIKILSRGGGSSRPKPTYKPRPTKPPRPTRAPVTPTPKPETSRKPPRPGGKECRAKPPYKPNLDKWCKKNCQQNFCPPSHCICE